GTSYNYAPSVLFVALEVIGAVDPAIESENFAARRAVSQTYESFFERGVDIAVALDAAPFHQAGAGDGRNFLAFDGSVSAYPGDPPGEQLEEIVQTTLARLGFRDNIPGG
ncbi:MAG: hypothetical protein AAF747_07405, partial [Planctomycetota bacterium]